MHKANVGAVFAPEQLVRLNLIRDHIATCLCIEPDDFENAPFSEGCSLGKAQQPLGAQLPGLLDEFNTTWAA